MKKFKTSLQRKIEYTLYIFLAIFVFYVVLNIFSYINFKKLIDDGYTFESNYCQYFIFTPKLFNQIDNKDLNFKKKEVYIFPDVNNIKCIGKVGDFVIKENTIKGYVYTNTKFINYLILIFNFGQMFLNFLFNFFSKKKFYILNIIINLLILFNFYNSLNLISFNFLFISHLIIYFINNEI